MGADTTDNHYHRRAAVGVRPLRVRPETVRLRSRSSVPALES
ncbi:hypothetical protein [Natronomonas sp. CBA1123]|nr:hypothetical protein [Natronomonas sp. CBA1123]